MHNLIKMYAELCVLQVIKKNLKTVVKCYKMDRIHLLNSFIFLEFWYMYESSEKPSPQSLPFVCFNILSCKRMEPVYFDFHVQRQIDLLALELPTCTNHCFESDKNVHSH